MQLTRAALATLAALAFASCGGGDATGRDSPSELLVAAAAALREQSTLDFSFDYVRTRADRPDEPERYAEGEGALDLGLTRGRLRFQLDPGLPSGAGSVVDEPFELRWDERSVEVEIRAKPRRLTRERARASGGLIGRLPDEPEAMIALLQRPHDAHIVRDDALGGIRVDVIGFTVEAGVAGRLGAPAELTGAATSGFLGESLELEAWIDDERLPRRIAMTITLDPVRSGGKLVLPARTVRVTYDLSAFGEPFRS